MPAERLRATLRLHCHGGRGLNVPSSRHGRRQAMDKSWGDFRRHGLHETTPGRSRCRTERANSKPTDSRMTAGPNWGQVIRQRRRSEAWLANVPFASTTIPSPRSTRFSRGTARAISSISPPDPLRTDPPRMLTNVLPNAPVLKRANRYEESTAQPPRSPSCLTI